METRQEKLIDGSLYTIELNTSEMMSLLDIKTINIEEEIKSLQQKYKDKQSLLDFYKISHDNFLLFLDETKTLVLDVNYWSWLEGKNLINPIWNYADHDDSIIEIPYIFSLPGR